ncbi:MAG: nucleotide exchange factor GrpE [Clostridia bacterium]|nr:nucleotide exchange factor GrpE [Clostridia bacterium]
MENRQKTAEANAADEKFPEGNIPIEDAADTQAAPKQDSAQAEEVTAQEDAAQTSESETPTQQEWAEALKKTVSERDAYKDNWMRTQAEFQNFKRRNASVRAESYDDGVREAIAAALPAIDNLELALKHAEAQGETGAMYDGVKMTLKLMTEALGKLGLEEVPALGEAFDPDKHNAVMREPGGEENVVTEVFQKGYKVKDKMIRYAMVKVSSGEEA